MAINSTPSLQPQHWFRFWRPSVSPPPHLCCCNMIKYLPPSFPCLTPLFLLLSASCSVLVCVYHNIPLDNIPIIPVLGSYNCRSTYRALPKLDKVTPLILGGEKMTDFEGWDGKSWPLSSERMSSVHPIMSVEFR